VHSWIESLRELCEDRNMSRLVVALKELVLDYNPSTDLLRRILDLEENRTLTTTVH
jgi:hypothetical protein